MSIDRHNDSKRQKRIKEITTRAIAALTQELESLAIQGVFTPIVNIGDEVVIKNNHLGLRGSTGIVVGETKTRYKVRLVATGAVIHRAKDNEEKQP
jgi:hypothetical protein